MMGVVFELVVNFGHNEPGVEAATGVVRSTGSVRVRGIDLPLGDPHVTRSAGPRGYIEFTVWARGVGYGSPAHPELDPLSMTEPEITAVGYDLYALLGRFDGYRAAIVGWDPEQLVDLHELESEWVAAGDINGLDGLVVATDLRNRWQLDDAFVPFAEGYWWHPYRGAKNVRR
jgi:hypothetical protein